MSESSSRAGDAIAVAGTFLSASQPARFVNREQERLRLHSLMEAAARSGGQTVVVSGESGIGKTRLAQEIVSEARVAGFHIGVGQCDELGQMLPNYPLIQAMSALYLALAPSLRQELTKRWPDVAAFATRDAMATASLRPPADEPRFLQDVTGFICTAAGDTPAGILLEDLHFADRYTLNAVAHLATHIDEARVLLVITCKTEATDAGVTRLDQVLDRMERERPVQRLPLQPFSRQDTEDLTRSLMEDGAASRGFIEFVYRQSRGNPGAAEAMVRSLGGRLTLERQIGVGGMAHVFRAYDSVSAKPVAAKIMLAEGDEDIEALLRFQQEGALLSTFEHPNIVTVYGSFLDETVSCIIMELLKGRSLADVFHDERVDLARAKSLLRQVAAGLSYAHERGIVHRDVKPENIMVLENDRVKVTDFGIARVQRPEEDVSITRAGRTMGTPLYMAPEQIEGRSVDGRADVYSFGAVMYQVATGRPPFEGDNPLTVAYKHVHELPVPPRQVNPSLPPDWEQVIVRCLSKDPGDRYDSAHDLEKAIADLEPVDRPTEATRPNGEDRSATSTLTDGGTASRRQPRDVMRSPHAKLPWPAAMIAGVMLLVILVAALVLLLH